MATVTEAPPAERERASQPVWQPFPGAQTDFLDVWKMAYEVLFGGSKGPGKTDCLVMEASRQVTHPRYRAVIFRRTYKQLQEIMDRMQRWYPLIGGYWRGTESRWVFPNTDKAIPNSGQVSANPAMSGAIGVSHMQHEGDKYNHQGREYHFLGFDQVEQFTETQYLYLLAQQRRAVPDLYVYARSTANPGGVGHGWVKRRFINLGPNNYFHDQESGTTRVFIPATMDDNPALMKNDPGYEHRLRLLGDTLFRAFRYGDWDVFEGQFFNMWRAEMHVISPFSIPKDWFQFMSLDYGYSAPSSIGWWAVDEVGRLVRHRELYKDRLTYTDLAHAILNRMTHEEILLQKYLVADPAIWSDIAHHKGEVRGETGYDIMQKVFNDYAAAHGGDAQGNPLKIIKADNDRINGWIRMRERLTSGNGPGGMVSFETCVAFNRTIPECIHDEKRPEDLDTDGEDHPADEGRYACMSRPQTAELPPPLQTAKTKFWDRVRKDRSRRGQAINADFDGLDVPIVM
jgi:hypothetical protein